MKTVIGIDIGGTKISGALFSLDGSILYDLKIIYDKTIADGAFTTIISIIEKLNDFSKLNNFKLGSIGLCVPGIYYSDSGNVWCPNIDEWDNYPLYNKLTNLVNKQIKIKIDSDRACYILGEKWKGCAKDHRNAIFLAFGTGIGAGILINDEILRGANDIAGAIGWLALEHPFNKKFIQCGCFEYYASGDGILRYAKELYKIKPFPEIDIDNLSTKTVFELYYSGHEFAITVIDKAILLWGMSSANLVSLFNPDIIIFGGGVFGPAVPLIPKIYDEAKKWAQPIGITKVKFEQSALGDSAGLYGAGYLALKNLN